MTLLVRVPDLHMQERKYVLDVVLGEWLGLPYDLLPHDALDVVITLAGDDSGAALSMSDRFFATPDADWLTDRSLPTEPLQRIYPESVSPGSNGATKALPLLFGDPGADGGGWHRVDTGLNLPVDVFGTVFFLLSRYEELVKPDRDAHGRFPSTASVLGAEEWVDRPIADEYTDLLWRGIHGLWPAVVRRESTFRIRLTHDVDKPWAVMGMPLRSIAQSLAADLVVRRDVGLSIARLRSLATVGSGRVDHDPLDRFDLFMDVAERHGQRTTFYFHAGGTSADFDFRYRPTDPSVARLMRQIHDRGHEIGLHTSYVSHLSIERTRHEFEALVAACEAMGFSQESYGVRQHFLRFENPATWRIQDAVGLAHDSTVGFFDRIGFRAGTSREFPVYDLIDRRVLRLRERPLLAMDSTLLQYMHLSLDDAATRVRRLVAACRIHGGTAVLLYHNNTMQGQSFEAHYRALIDGLFG